MAKNTHAQHRGFAAIDDQKQREIAQKGGNARAARSAEANTTRQSSNSDGTSHSSEDGEHPRS